MNNHYPFIRGLLVALLVTTFVAPPAISLGFDMGTAMKKGRLELDLTLNPFEAITYGQNYLFIHYGIGDGFELHSYLSKHGTIQNWENNTYEVYFGILKQWVEWPLLDLSSCLGIRKVISETTNPSLIGPGILYTVKVIPRLRIGGHLLYIGEIFSRESPVRLENLGRGYSFEAGLYYAVTPAFELAFGAFTNTSGITRPTYSLNFYP